MNQSEMDMALWRVKSRPVIHVGPYHPIKTWDGYGNPYPDYYKGHRIVVEPTLYANAYIEETGST